MGSTVPQTLQRAAAYLQAGQPHLARPLLIEVVKQQPSSEAGWLLLSEAVAEPRQKIDCLQRVLRLNPGNVKAQARLRQLLTPAPERVAPIVTPPTSPAASAPAIREPTRGVPPARSAEAAAPKRSDLDALRAAAVRRPAAKRRSKSRFKKMQWAIMGVTLLVAVAMIGIAVVLLLSPGASPSDRAAAPVVAIAATPTRTPQPSPTERRHPPTWTPTPTPAPTSTRTATPFPTLNPTLIEQMDRIEEQVADLRGLPSGEAVPRLLIRREAVEHTLRQMLIEQGYAETLADQARSLSALGLIKPTYDLFKYAMNGLADNIGGFYIPWLKQLFVIGTRFGGVERFVFAHEFDHALTDQHFNIDTLGVYPDCLSNNQRCAAIRALVEGDATLLMQQWWLQYAGPQDYQDILRYRPPSQMLPEDYPPPYVSRDLEFPYLAGLDFVEFLHKRGNWAEVNRAYENLPDSTEQILHPEKYIAGEQPLEVAALPLAEALGADWRLIDDDVLGEWTTYLILSAGADLAAQIDDVAARSAARGWGGDRYQVYYNDVLSHTVLAAEWVWDAPREATEFRQAMVEHLGERFRGAKLDHAAGQCWEANHQASCLFVVSDRSLWLLAPDITILDAVLAQYPDFQ
ncbi:hypothetical protein TFLX_02974 [Thermoflexales bacterium]|nr:hypothetical protein TFLX_02974 [Thermoflexales bacterium]